MICTIVYKAKATYQRYSTNQTVSKETSRFQCRAAREVSPLGASQRNYTSLFDDCNLHTRRRTFIVSRYDFAAISFPFSSPDSSRENLSTLFSLPFLIPFVHGSPLSITSSLAAYLQTVIFANAKTFHGTCFFFISFFLCFTCKHVVFMEAIKFHLLSGMTTISRVWHRTLRIYLGFRFAFSRLSSRNCIST